jgi:peptide/nickel transport system permease protein
VAEVIGYPLRNSILLGLVTALVAIPVALAIGIAAAYWRGRWPDVAASGGAIVGYSIPEFASGNFLILCFAIWLPIFPAMITAFTKDAPSVLLASAFLPVLTVVIGSIAHLVRLVRAGFIESLNSDYVERARLAGSSNLSVVLRHALPASVIPALNSAALYVAGLLSGIIVVEKVFAYPGLGLGADQRGREARGRRGPGDQPRRRRHRDRHEPVGRRRGDGARPARARRG